MDLPTFRRGLELVSADLNKLSHAVRAASVTSVIGGTFSRTPGGTTIVVNDQVRNGGSEGGSAIPCPFAVSDASIPNQLKIEISWGLIWQMLPTGMLTDNDPPLRINITNSCFVYSAIKFDLDTLLPDQITFQTTSTIQSNTSDTQYNLIAVVTVDTDAEPPVISRIRNQCQQPFPSPCSLS
jgi:hypothetical protein